MTRGLGAIALAAIIATPLAGCSAPAPSPEPTTTASPSASAEPLPGASPTPDPTLDPAAGAQGNLAYFDLVATRLLDARPDADGRTIIDTLVAGGFDKTRMEVTPDRTAVDLAADSIQFSVRFDDGCLIGQGGSKTGFASEVRAVLGTGRCLIGETRPIDW